MKRNKGITLIALVITIIILLILAGVTIATLTGDNGLLQQAGKVKILTEIGEIEEKVRLKTLENENQQLIEGSLDSVELDISEDIINKYKDILYIKDSKLYLSFVANYPQIDLYKNNEYIIDVLKDKLDITYQAIKAYNKVINPYFDDGANDYIWTNKSTSTRDIITENNNNYLRLNLKTGNGTSHIKARVNATENYDVVVYINMKYKNDFIENEDAYIINNDIGVVSRQRRRI